MDDLERIESFIAQHHVMSLATSGENGVSACSLFYAYDTKTKSFIVASSDDTLHIKNILQNKNIAGNILLETKNLAEIQGLQFSGEFIVLKNEKQKELYFKEFPYAKDLNPKLWQIEVENFKLTDNRLGFGKKIIVNMSEELGSLEMNADKSITSIIEDVFEFTDRQNAVVVYDTNSTLSTILYKAYKIALPQATFIEFDTNKSEEILQALADLEESDFVALIQSTNFRLNAFRIRVELFKHKIKVIEHPHLSRMSEEEIPAYIDSLLYDKEYYRSVGYALKEKIDNAKSGVIESDGEFLYYECAFESAKLNIGDYSQMKNWGGQFPIGEVFTEAKDLEALHGRVKISVFSNTSYRTNKPENSAILIIEKGKVIATENTTPAFDEVLELIREGEGAIWVRELGFGLNRAFSKSRVVSDTGTYERMCGVHLSLGRKHGMYAKPGIKRGEGKFHIDVFVDTTTVKLDDAIIFENEAWIV